MAKRARRWPEVQDEQQQTERKKNEGKKIKKAPTG
jgi:hypothetical protein